MEYATFLFFALIGYKENAIAPIIVKDAEQALFVDPLPQALVLTAIVIGLGTTTLMISIAVRIFEKYKTFDIRRISKLKG
jgi:multisubunit Na+/H+ antiporter MnhC subunit